MRSWTTAWGWWRPPSSWWGRSPPASDTQCSTTSSLSTCSDSIFRWDHSEKPNGAPGKKKLYCQASTLLPLVKMAQTFLCLYEGLLLCRLIMSDCWSALFEDHYPHTLKSVHILNTSPLMKTIFRLTKVKLQNQSNHSTTKCPIGNNLWALSDFTLIK